MNQAPEFDPSLFTANFFTAYEQQLADIDIAEQAAAALADVLSVHTADGSQKTYQQIRTETSAFFANDWVRQNELLMNQMAVNFAAACMTHPHGAALAQDSSLSALFEKGQDASYNNKHLHEDTVSSRAHDDEEDEDDDEIDPRTGKKRKSPRRSK